MSSTPATVVRAATVLTPSGPLSPGEVVLDQGLLVEIRPAQGAVEYEVLAPGFIDLQMNGIGEIDVATATGAEWDALDRALLAQGVTTWCPTLCSAPLPAMEASLSRMAEAAERSPEARPTMAGAHLEGPFLAVAGAHPEAFLLKTVDRDWLASVRSGVALVTLAPELPGALEAIKSLAGAGILVAIGHSACEIERVGEAAAAGARLVTHLGNAMGPFSQRAPGIFGGALADDRLAVSLIGDLVHIHPALLRIAFRAKGRGRTVLVTDAVATGAGSGITSGVSVPADGGPPRMADGTLVGSVLTMDGAVRNSVGAAGIGLDEVVAAASATPAQLLGLADRGEIVRGRRADLVALDGGLRTERVWIAGQVAWSRPG